MAESHRSSVPDSLVNDILKRLCSLETGDDDSGSSVDDLPQVKDIMKEELIKSIHNVEERFKMYAKKCVRLLHVDPKKVQRDISCTEDYIMQIFRERKQFIIEKEDKRLNVHRDALKKCYHHIISDLELVNSSVLDRLLEDDVMSVSDKDSIIMKRTKKLQNEEFYRYVYGKVTFEAFQNSLLPSLKKDHPHLAGIISAELDTLEESTEDAQCGTCKALKIVQVKRLATSLFKTGVIDNAVHADLRSDAITNSQKWKELLEHANVPVVHIINAMEKEYPDLYHDFRRGNMTELKCFCGVPDTLSVVSDSAPAYWREVFANTTTGAGDVAALDDLQSFLSMPVQDAESAYPMNARPRGICVIINNRDFQENQADADGCYERQHRLGRREGTDADAKRLEYIFSKLEFTLRLFTNLTDTQMVEKLQCVASMTDHKPFDAFVCCILSHGVKDRVYGTNCREVKVSDLTVPFKASSCPSLAGKPKMFFIQAAQGNVRMQGLNVEDGLELPLPREGTAVDASVVREDLPHDRSDNPKCPSQGSPKELNIIPDESDFGYATSPGYVSYRSKRHGSWYIMKLAEVLETYGDRLDLLSCLLMVNDEVANGNAITNDGVYKQVPAPVFTLRKKVNFTSDPVWFRSLSTINEKR